MTAPLTIAEAAPLLRHSVSGLRKLLRHPDPERRPPAHRVGGRLLFIEAELALFLASSPPSHRPGRRERKQRPGAVKARLELVAREVRI